MSRLTSRGRSRISAKNFVFPKGTKAAKGEPKFPIHDRTHARSALSRAAQKRTKLTKAERCKVVAAVCKKFPKMGLCETGKVSAKSALKGCPKLSTKGRKPAASKKAAAPRAPARRSRTRPVRSREIMTVERWMKSNGFPTTRTLGPIPKRDLYLYTPPGGRPGSGLAMFATSLADAKRQTEESYSRRGEPYDLKYVRRATKQEDRDYAADMAKWD